MKSYSLAIAALCAVASLNFAPRAQASGHGVRIDEGNGSGCMSTWTTISDPTGLASFIPGGTYANEVACQASGSPSVLFPNGVVYNDASGQSPTSAYLATSGEMFQYFAGAVGAVPDSEVVVWTLGNKSNDTEVELDAWCPGGSGASFSYGGTKYTGGCSGSATTDLLFDSSKKLIGYVSDSSSSSTVVLSTTLPGWTYSGGTISAPEIDPSSAIAAFTLLAGGLAVVRGRTRRAIR